MNKATPFVEPNREFTFNAAVMLVILQRLSATKTGKKIMNLDRLQIFHFLTLRPAILASVIAGSGKTMALEDTELFQVPQEGVTPDLAISLKKIKSLITYLGASNFIRIQYSEKDGFVFELTESGQEKAGALVDNYFDRIRSYAEVLAILQSVSIPQLNERIKLATTRL